jgi:hypothetical protein
MGGMNFGGMMMGTGSGNLTGVGSSTNVATTNLILANVAAFGDTNGDGGMTFEFTIAGGSNGVSYDVFATTNLPFGGITNTEWTWLGQGTNGGTYVVTNQTTNQQFYVLGTPQLDSDNSGFTTAFENLIIKGSPYATNTGTPGGPVGLAFSLGLIPNYNYLANSSMRINYGYDSVGRLWSANGTRNESMTNDNEGNVLLAH